MERTGKRFYMSQSSLYGLTVYDRIMQTPAFGYGAEQNMREFDAINLTTKLNTTLGRTLNLCDRYPELGDEGVSDITHQMLRLVADKYRLSSEQIESAIFDYLTTIRTIDTQEVK